MQKQKKNVVSSGNDILKNGIGFVNNKNTIYQKLFDRAAKVNRYSYSTQKSDDFNHGDGEDKKYNEKLKQEIVRLIERLKEYMDFTLKNIDYALRDYAPAMRYDQRIELRSLKKELTEELKELTEELTEFTTDTLLKDALKIKSIEEFNEQIAKAQKEIAKVQKELEGYNTRIFKLIANKSGYVDPTVTMNDAELRNLIKEETNKIAQYAAETIKIIDNFLLTNGVRLSEGSRNYWNLQKRIMGRWEERLLTSRDMPLLAQLDNLKFEYNDLQKSGRWEISRAQNKGM